MLLNLAPDQVFFRDTTAKFLAQEAPVAELRRLRHDPAGYRSDYWRSGAELGWTSLLVDEARGGGTISGDGLVDLTLVAHEFGRHAAPGPLTPTNVVAAALSRQEPGAHEGLLADLLAGTTVASWCHAERRPGAGPDDLSSVIEPEGREVVVNGLKRPVESAGRASHLLVTGRTGRGVSQVVVPADAAGVSLEPLRTVDLTRRFASVSFRDVRVGADALLGEPGAAGAQVARQLLEAAVIGNAESIGAMQAAFDMTVEWAFDRYSFGRPLASYQELKHRFADMKTWLEAAHAISDAAAGAVAAGSPEAAETASAAKCFVGDYGSELLQDCVQIHGGIGVTFEHDLHLFLRRHTTNRGLFGTPADHRQRLAGALRAGEVAS